MPTFNDSENLAPSELLPVGDYKWKCVEFGCTISKGGKTAGSDSFKIKVTLEGHPNSHVKENLIDHASCAWKIDCFLKSAGVKLAKGEAFEFRKDLAEKLGVKWINPIGLRGWCRLIQEEYEKNNEKRFSNKIGTFYADKEKLPPDEAMRAEVDKADEDKPF